jgi:two-component system NtrC family response regulator
VGYRKILIVEDEISTLESLKALLEIEDFAVDTAPDFKTAKQKLSKHYYPLVLLDLFLPDGRGEDLLPLIDPRRTKVVVLTGHGSVSTAVECMRRGAFDFLEKPIRSKELLKVLEKALAELGDERDGDDEEILKGLVGFSPVIRRLKQELVRIAKEDKNVLIRGEEGVGKSFIAALIHKLSPRSSFPLERVVIRGKSDFELERELFGSRIPGKEKIGAFEKANGGSVVLVGVENLSPKLQEKLLTVLRERRFTPLGDNRECLFNVRLLSTTSKNLYEMSSQGRFSGELLLLIDEIELEIPPLRERREDILPLLNLFIEELAKEGGYEKPILSEEISEFLMNYDFPGNVRELKNLAERLVLLYGGKVVSPSDLQLVPSSKREEDIFSILNWREAKKRFEREFLRRKLMETGGDVKKVARLIKLDISNVYRKIKEYGLEDFLKKG